MDRFRIWQPFLLAAALAVGLLAGYKLSRWDEDRIFHFGTGRFDKLNDVINYISQEYVDTVDSRLLVDNALQELLHSLDPHSSYIPSEELQAVNEPLEGNFDGIGIEFHIQDDTIMVVSPIAGGPSEELGILSGDRIIRVDGKNVAHIDITNSQVMKLLRGPGGSKVKIAVYRRSTGKTTDYTIVRGKIPIHSVDVGYLPAPGIGYIKISHFAENTFDEFSTTLSELKRQGAVKLILDLRGNPGGYLTAAIKVADEFLPEKRLVVYTEGRSRVREDYFSTADGAFENGEVVVLIDEGSASASEIVSGALQDWDRATIIGRRSYGKGLVQEQSELADGSAIRLTVARYFTPTGRCIQKPYDEDYASYENELLKRFEHGELVSSDSIRFADSLKYTTPGGKVVYGGGGIMPDVFVPIDSGGLSVFYTEVIRSGLLNQFAYDLLDREREGFKRYGSFGQFNSEFEVDEGTYEEFIRYVSSKGVTNQEGKANSRQLISSHLKALIARQLWENEGFYPVINADDKTIRAAIDLLNGKRVALKK